MGTSLKLTIVPLALALMAGCSSPETSNSQKDREVAASAPSLALAGRVTDAAQLLSSGQEDRLSAKLASLERTTGHQMVVVTVPTLGGKDVAIFTRDLANDWGIGRKGHDDGVVLLIAPNERKARIAVGYGLQDNLPDALCQRIMDEGILPRFREGELARGIEAGVDALVSRLN